MKLRKLFAFVMVLALVALAACGPQDNTNTNDENAQATQDQTDNSGDNANNADANKPEKLIVWEDQGKEAAIEAAAKKFEEKYGIKIEHVEYNITKMQENMALDGGTDKAPDVVTMSHDGVGPSVVKGYIAPLNESDDVLSNYTQSSIDALTYQGKLYALPKATETTVLIYNKDLLPEAPKTMDELYNLSKEAIKKKDNYGFLATWDNFYFSYGVFDGFGGYTFGKDTKDIGLNNDGSVEAMKYINKWYQEGLFPRGIIGEKSADVMSGLFKKGQAVAVQNGPWSFKDYQDAGINIGMAPMPTLPNGNHIGTYMGVKGWFVTNFSKNKDWAQKFVEFVSNPENAKERYQLTGEIPPVKALIDDKDWVKSNPGAAAVMAQSQYAVAMPSVPEMAEVWDPMAAAVQTVATGKAEPKAALDQAVQTIKEQIEANY